MISTAPDPMVMAPFQEGDFITFTGFRKGNEVIAFSIVAQNVQIQTLGDIVYVRMELGLLGIDNPNPNAEIAESRVSTHRVRDEMARVLTCMKPVYWLHEQQPCKRCIVCHGH